MLVVHGLKNQWIPLPISNSDHQILYQVCFGLHLQGSGDHWDYNVLVKYKVTPIFGSNLTSNTFHVYLNISIKCILKYSCKHCELFEH